MITIIPLAGKSERFTKAGYEYPKWMLPVDSETMLLKVIESSTAKNVITVFSKGNYKDVANIVIRYCIGDMHKSWLPIEIYSPAIGPLETILRAKQYLKTSDELLINYCDCWAKNGLTDFLTAMRTSSAEAGAYCFRSTNPRFQYDPSGEYALGGIFWFRHADEFLKRARRFEMRSNLSPAHIAFTYKFAGLDKWHLYVDTENYVDLGTPDDYERYIGKSKRADLPIFDSFDSFMASDQLGNWRKDRIGYILYRSVTKQYVTEEEKRELAADMQKSIEANDAKG